MPNYHPNAKSLVYGLSDFWTLYFRELPVLEDMYRGVEIEVGQVYLDLLSLLLTTSLQDTPLFDKQYFKLIRLREDGVTYGSDGQYGIALQQDIADLKYLNNRVFGVTSALERNVDFRFDAAARSVLFNYDPFAAYRARTYGTGNASFTLTTRVTEPLAGQLRFQLDDTSVHPPEIVRDGYDVVVSYAAGTTTAAEIVALINNDPQSQGLFSATLPGATTGADSPADTALLPLQRQAVEALQGFALRTFDVLFGTRFTDAHAPRWLDIDVQKGDVLRILGAPNYGPAQEFPIALVKDDRLILYPQVAPADLNGIDYAILRSPVDDQVIDEPFFTPPALEVVFDVNTTIIGATRTLEFNSPLFPLPEVFKGQVVSLNSPVNAGQYVVVDIIMSPYSWVVDGNPLVDEANATTTLLTANFNFGTDGFVAAPVDGIALFSTVSGFFSPSSAGGVLTVDHGGGALSRYPIVRRISTTSVEIEAPNIAPAVGLTFAYGELASGTTSVMFSAPVGWLVPGSVTINARRWLDGTAVIEGRDYVVNYDTGSVQTLSVWYPSYTNRISYQYRLAQYSTHLALSGAGSGTLSVTDAPHFVSPAAAFSAADLGGVLRILNASLPENNGDYSITAIVSATEVVLSALHTPVLPDANNGSLTWEIYARGAAVVTDVVEPVHEIGVWAPDAKVDKYHLYFTYGYLIDRIQSSSEAYRALIRGLFQLFMLGPTLERFESAINIVAALPVIRDDGEIFLDYESGALRMGTDGVFDAFTRTFTSASAAFVPSDLSNRIYVKTGYNANKIFNIAAVIDATTVLLVETPTTNTAVAWEITATAEHAIVTSRDRYTFPRNAPLKAKFLNPANEGVMVLRAFEVVTSAFEVTDYVESPTWWENARIPQTLLPGYTPQRRQATPALFENVINPADGGCIGDPGFFIGADDEGDVIPKVVLQSDSDGTIYGDPLYPSRETEYFFEAPSASFDLFAVGNYIRTDGREFLITQFVSPTRVKIVSYIPYLFTGVFTGVWELITGTLPLRHNVAYMILDTMLKYHLFTVRFDAYLLEQLPSNVIRDLQELVFVAKPTYTYLLLTPGLVFEDIIRITEDTLAITPVLAPGGRAGETILGNTNELTIGPEWTIGSWYRYVENTSTFAVPASPLPNTLGTPGAGYQYRPTKVYVDPTTLTHVGTSRPVSYDELVYRANISGVAGEITIVGYETVFTVDYPAVASTQVLNYLHIPAPSPNAGVYRIGRLLSDTELVIDAPGLTPEAGVAWEILAVGGQEGRISYTAEGQSLFTDPSLDFTFNPGDVGRYIRRTYVATARQDTYRIAEYISSNVVRVAKDGRMVLPGTTFTANVLTANTVEVPDVYFNEAMTYFDRLLADASTARQREYFLRFDTGANAGTTVRLLKYLSPTIVQVSGTLAVETGATVEPHYEDHYTGVPEGGPWEVYEHTVYVDTLSASPDDLTLPVGVNADTLDYTSYGVQEPVFPLTVAFDATAGDSYYTIGGVNPVLRYMRSRTALDPDLIEAPVQIKRTTPPFFLTVGGNRVTAGGNQITII